MMRDAANVHAALRCAARFTMQRVFRRGTDFTASIASDILTRSRGANGPLLDEVISTRSTFRRGPRFLFMRACVVTHKRPAITGRDVENRENREANRERESQDDGLMDVIPRRFYHRFSSQRCGAL